MQGKIKWSDLNQSINSDEGFDKMEELFEGIINLIDWKGCKRYEFNQLLKMKLGYIANRCEDELRDGVGREDSNDDMG